jgi:hypothetical protein
MIEAGIHAGERTHHQLQLITWQSFKMMNATSRSPPIPIPPELALVLSLIIYFHLAFCSPTAAAFSLPLIASTSFNTSASVEHHGVEKPPRVAR